MKKLKNLSLNLRKKTNEEKLYEEAFNDPNLWEEYVIDGKKIKMSKIINNSYRDGTEFYIKDKQKETGKLINKSKIKYVKTIK